MKKVKTTVIFVLLITMLFFSSLLFFFTIWVTGYFSGDISFDQLLFYIWVPLKGTSSEILKDGLLKSLIPPIILVIVAVLGLAFVAKVSDKIVLKLQFRSFKHVFTIWPIVIHKRLSWIILATILASIGLIQLQTNYNLIEFSHSMTESSTFVQDNYIEPHAVDLKFPESKRNLIFIYLESMESSFADIESGGLSEYNHIPNLTNLASGNIHFSDTNRLGGAKQITGTGWTIASMFAQSSGLNLRMPLNGNGMNRYGIFFPGAKSLGDILKEQGYTNVLMVGSDASFGGRELYYKSHGNYEIYDYHWAIESGLIPDDYYVWWGFEDAKLFEYAKQKLTQLAASNNPFNFTMLTVDTHHDGGYISEGDYKELFDSQYANVIATSDRQTADFVRWIQAQNFYENTTIIITGDHLTMDSLTNDQLGPTQRRRVYNAFINVPEQQNKHFGDREFSLVDMFPTTLAALGVTIPGDSLGLGVNLFSPKPTILERYGQETVDSELNKRSTLYDRLFSTPYADL